MKTNRPAFQIGCLILAGILVSGGSPVARGQYRWHDLDCSGDLKCGDYARATTSSDSRGGGRTPGRSRRADAEPGKTRSGFQRRKDERAEDVDTGGVCTGARSADGTVQPPTSPAW